MTKLSLIFVTTCLLLASPTLDAQVEKVTALRSRLLSEKDAKERAMLFLDLAATIQEEEPDSAILYANNYAKIGKIEEITGHQYHHFDVLGQIFEVQGKLDSSEASYKKALATDFAQRKANLPYKLATLNRLAITLTETGETEKALEIRMDLALQVTAIKDTLLQIKNLVNLGNLLKELNRQVEGLSYLIEARELALAPNIPPIYQAVASSNICKIFLDDEECTAGGKYCEEALTLAVGTSEATRGAIASNLAGCLTIKGDVDRAKKIIFKELSNVRNAFSRQALLKSLVSAYILEEKYDSSLLYEREVLKISKQLNRRDLEASAYRGIASIANKAKRYQEGKTAAAAALKILKQDERYNRTYSAALANYIDGHLSLENHQIALLFRDYVSLSRQFFDEDRQASLNEIEEKYQTRIRQDSITNLTVRSEFAEQQVNSRTWQLSLAGLLAAILFGGVFYFRRLNSQLSDSNKQVQAKNQELEQAKEELEDQNHQIQTLNADLNHRTSNYLDSIKILLERQRDSAEDAGLDVSVVNSLERQVLAFTKVQSKLKETLDDVNLKEYLEDFCEAVRDALAAQGKPVQFDVNIADVDVKPAFAAPLALIINELATNSMKYARREDGLLRIALDAVEVNDGELRVFYRDGGEQEGEVDQRFFSSGQGVETILGFTDQLKGRVVRYGEESYDYEVVFGLEG